MLLLERLLELALPGWNIVGHCSSATPGMFRGWIKCLCYPCCRVFRSAVILVVQSGVSALKLATPARLRRVLPTLMRPLLKLVIVSHPIGVFAGIDQSELASIRSLKLFALELPLLN